VFVLKETVLKIHVYTVAWNEELMMPFFLRHYLAFSEKIVVFDNESTDRTAEIVRACPRAELRSYATDNQNSERSKLSIKNQAYKESRGRADWVIVCDVDEFLYHPRLVGLLGFYRLMGINFPKVRGFDIVPGRMPDTSDNLAEQYRLGVPSGRYDKRIIFSPELDMDFAPGSHRAAKPNGSRETRRPKLKLLHYKMLTADYFVQRNRLLGARRSKDNIQNHWGTHYTAPAEVMVKQYETAFADRLPVDSWRERPFWHRALGKLQTALMPKPAS
jgi:glycosyltransferase involved in cell wall biosynthesis